MIELYQPMTEVMSEIYSTIVMHMSSTLLKLIKSNATVRFQSFSSVARDWRLMGSVAAS